jgi:hypothetical protein
MSHKSRDPELWNPICRIFSFGKDEIYLIVATTIATFNLMWLISRSLWLAILLTVAHGVFVTLLIRAGLHVCRVVMYRYARKP